MSKINMRSLVLPDYEGGNCFDLRASRSTLTLVALSGPKNMKFQLTVEEAHQLIEILRLCAPKFDDDAVMPGGVTFCRDDQELAIGVYQPYSQYLGLCIKSDSVEEGLTLSSRGKLPFKILDTMLLFIQEWVQDFEFDREKEQLVPAFGLPQHFCSALDPLPLQPTVMAV